MKKNSTQKSSRIVSLFARIFKFAAWLDIARVRAFFIYMIEGAKRMAAPPLPQRNKPAASFDVVAEKVGLTEASMAKQANALLWWSRLLFLASLCVLGVAIYHGLDGSVRACLMSILVMMVGLTLSFRYHFLYYQIKEKKLGCTVQEWFRCGLMGRRHA